VVDLEPSDGPGPLSIAEFYAEVEAALRSAFPRGRALWVRGELQKLTVAGSGHAYLDLVDPDAGDRPAVLSLNAWRSTWGPLKRELADQGIALEAGMTLTVRGTINFYPPRGQVSLTLEEIDVEALLGRLARQRQELIDALRSAELLDAQRRLSAPVVPLRIGLVASPGTEGYKDFLGQLERSGFGFEVSVARASVQGAHAAAEVAAAVRSLDRLGLDAICVVRGGGAKADLAAFDAADVAYAIAQASTPVLTGIGHTGDESVADLVAHATHITPTACGAALVAEVAAYWNEVAAVAERCLEATESLLEGEAEAHAETRRVLVASARRALVLHGRELAHLRRTLVVAPGATLAREEALVAGRGQRLVPAARRHLAAAGDRLESTRRLLGAFDPRRALERGWSLTRDATGAIVRSVGALEEGATITTTLADGSVDSTVLATSETAGSEE
jgi:exodeoxyribonuclease VII large subunit